MRRTRPNSKRIRALLDEGFPVTDKQTGRLRPVTPGDIVILLRSPRSKAPTYIAELERIGVTASAEQRGGLLETAEVGTMVSLLSVIDNPRQDVDLIGVMRSPLFGFTEQELADIRLVDRKISYYDALLQSRTDFPKVETFLQRLDFLRTFACDQPVYRLLWEIYDQTGALGLYGALPNGAQRQSNLLTFFERARSFEGQGFRGLFDFVRLLRGMLEQGEDFQTVGAEATGGAVRILSIHKSKGLEFPVVYVVGMEEGIFPGASAQYDQEELEEERRLCYVAMTRAKEKLTLTNARQRMLYGRTSANRASRFLEEIPEENMRWESKPEPRFGGMEHDGTFGGDRYEDGWGSSPARAGGAWSSGGVHSYRAPAQAPQRPLASVQQASSTRKNAAPAAPLLQLQQGDMVEHTAFGKGMVLSVRPMGGDALAEVAFDTVGKKKLMLKSAGAHMRKL